MRIRTFLEVQVQGGRNRKGEIEPPNTRPEYISQYSVQKSETEQSEQKNTEQESEPQNAQPTQDETVSELEQALSDQPTEEPFNQKEQQILNRLNLDPSRVLRYRLNLQHQRNQR